MEQLSFDDLGEPEEWREIPGYEGVYLISSLGRVKSLHGKNKAVTARGGILKQAIDVHGYPVVNLCVGGVRNARPVHRFLAAAFLGLRPEGEEVCHKDGNRLNCRLANLEYKDHKGNMEDMVLHGRSHPKKTHCKYGHEFTPENTRMVGTSRRCIECNKRRSSDWYYANRSPRSVA